MNTLPSSIETYLYEAGFALSEILVLKHLLLQDSLTVRQLGAKSGKNPGVVDSAVRKLLHKGIITKDLIDGTYKFRLVSLESVSLWMRKDITKKRDELSRRHENFESFLQTLTVDKKRPEMEHFTGDDGMLRVYEKVLKQETKEMLQYVPVTCTAEDDPLRDARVAHFRERHRRGVFSRVIAHDTMMGRRFRTRDPFEYRKSLLVSQERYPFTYEKIIAGDTVTCINFQEKQACFIRYPELATMERIAFEAIWKRETEDQKAAEAQANDPLVPQIPEVPMRIKTLSRLREFFVSKESLVTLGILALVAGGLTFGLYRYTSSLNLQRIKDRVQSVAATGASQFSYVDLNQLQKEEDWKKPEWAKVVNKLKEIRDNNDGVIFTYIIRKISVNSMEFVADADSLNPYANSDDDTSNDVSVDDNGKKGGELAGTSADALSWPGQKYNDVPKEAFDAYQKNTTSEIYTDQWGTYISGYAPILDDNGKTVAVLAADVKATQLQKMNAQTFMPTLYFLGIFGLFVLIRLAAFNRSLFKEVWEVFQMRKALIIVTLCAELAFGITFGLYEYMLHQTINETGNRLMSIAATAAMEFNPNDLDQLRIAEDMQTDAYQRVFQKLNQIKNANPDLTYIYIYRSIDQQHLFEWIADSYANYNLPEIGPDVNEDGTLDEADENIFPGMSLWITEFPSAPVAALTKPTYEPNFYTDQWGTWISGYAPIKDSSGKTHAILGADNDVSHVYDSLHKKFAPWLWFMAGFSVLLLLNLLFQKYFK